MVHHTPDRFAPRALRRRLHQTVSVELTPYELHLLAETLEANAARAAVNSQTLATAGDWFGRAAELREAAR